MDRTALLILPGTPTEEEVMDYLLKCAGAINIDAEGADEGRMFNVTISVSSACITLETPENEQQGSNTQAGIN